MSEGILKYVFLIALQNNYRFYTHHSLHKNPENTCSPLGFSNQSWLLLPFLLLMHFTAFTPCALLLYLPLGKPQIEIVHNIMPKERGSKQDSGRLGKNTGALHGIFMPVGTRNQAPPQWLLSYLTWVLTGLPYLQASILVVIDGQGDVWVPE